MKERARASTSVRSDIAEGGGPLLGLSRKAALRRTAIAFLLLSAFARLVAFGRETSIAYLFGVASDTDAYVAATALPELVAGVLLSGVLGYVVIPEFYRRKADDPEDAAGLLQAATWQVLLYSGALTLLAIVAAGPLVTVFAPGLDASQYDNAVSMLRVASPAIIFYGLAGVFSAVLNTDERFLPIPLSLIAGNAIGIGVLIACSTFGIVAAAMGYVISAIGLAVYQGAALHRRGGLKLGRPVWRGPLVSGLVKGAAIAILVISAPFVRNFFERVLASTASTGDLAALGFATRLILTVGTIVAVSVGTVVFPNIARHAAAGEHDRFLETIRRAMTLVIALSIPVSVVFALAPEVVVGILFEHGEFTESDTATTGAIVRAFSLGIVAICVSEILLRALFALGAQRRAFVAVYITLALNLALDVWLLEVLGVEGLGIGASIALWANAVLLGVILAKALREGPEPEPAP